MKRVSHGHSIPLHALQYDSSNRRSAHRQTGEVPAMSNAKSCDGKYAVFGKRFRTEPTSLGGTQSLLARSSNHTVKFRSKPATSQRGINSGTWDRLDPLQCLPHSRRPSLDSWQTRHAENKSGNHGSRRTLDDAGRDGHWDGHNHPLLPIRGRMVSLEYRLGFCSRHLTINCLPSIAILHFSSRHRELRIPSTHAHRLA